MNSITFKTVAWERKERPAEIGFKDNTKIRKKNEQKSQFYHSEFVILLQEADKLYNKTECVPKTHFYLRNSG